MTVALLLVMHGKLASALRDTLSEILGELPLRVALLEVGLVQAHGGLLQQGLQLVEGLDAGAGVLILTDAYGATPSNIANQIGAARPGSTQVVSGTNLPMLLRICNYAQQPLAQLAQLAVEGGQRGIALCPKAQQH